MMCTPRERVEGRGKTGLDYCRDWTGARERQQDYAETPVVKEPCICVDFREETISDCTGNFV
jgi:hypothetical protein